MPLYKLPLISIVMVDGSFRESFHALDFFGKQTLPPDQYELIWVEYYDKIYPALAEAIARYPNFQAITLNRAGLYHSSYCFNTGIRASRGELVIIPDADVVVEEDFLQAIWDEHQKTDDLAMYLYRRDEPREAHRPDWDLEHLRRVGRIANPINYGACLSVRKKWLVAINGYEQYPIFGSGLHANGLDVYTRFKNLGLAIKWHPAIRLYHPWHPQTGAGGYAYDLQREIISFRARHFETMAYEGLDPERNVLPAPELVAKLAVLKNRLSKRQGNMLERLVYYIDVLASRFKASRAYHRARATLPKEF